jgi:type IV pilus assembly protein PilB
MAKMPPLEQLKGRTLGRILIKIGLLTREQIQKCLEVQQKDSKGRPLGEILIELGLITEEQVRIALAAQRGMEFVDIDGMDVPDNVIKQIPAQMANTYRIIPVEYDDRRNNLTVIMDNPDNFRATDDLSRLMGFRISAKITTVDALERALKKYYGKEEESIGDLIGELEEDKMLAEFQGRDASIDLEELKELSESNPVKKLLNLVLLQAIRDKASDIHFEPFEKEYKMRYRIDGVLYEMVPPPKHIAVALSSRIKVMANLDIAERRLPQDGRIPLVVQGHPIDLRVSVLPTMFGESVVLRVLDRSQVNLDLEKLGIQPDDLSKVRQLINKPNGVVIVCGPTGSGKTTTLYSALNELNSPEIKLITTEDPVEYDIDGLIQVQVNAEVGASFAKCLRSILRQDPDVILVGECRDLETAQIAIQASLTGHLVLTTVHTNDAPSTIARLIDLGLEPFLITATVEGVIAQRLVRKICSSCKTAFDPTDEMLMDLGLTHENVKGKKFYYGKGCEQCNSTGYRGRMGIYEIMTLNDEIRDLIMNNASTNIIRSAARKQGMKLLRQNGLLAIYDGLTTIEEVIKETFLE